MSIIPEPKCSLYMYEDDSLRVFVNQLTKEITFSISDVAEVLGYPDQKRMTRCLDDSECKTVTLQSKQQSKSLCPCMCNTSYRSTVSTRKGN